MINLLVLARASEPQLAMLAGLPADTVAVVGDSAEAFERVAPDAEAILNWSGSRDLLRAVFLMAPRVRWVHSRAAGLDHMLFPELVAGPAVVTNSRGVFSQSLGEFVLAGVLYFAKDLGRMVRSRMAGVWDPFEVATLDGRAAGIVGYGDIGRAAAVRLRAMGMRILAVKRRPPEAADPLVEVFYTPDRRLEMLALSDYVVVAAPLTPETRGLIGAAEFAAMRPNAVVINVGRGPVIDEPAMVRALAGGHIRGAALDVFEREPLPAGHPFYRMENVLLSPHCADHTADWLDRAMRFFLANFQRFRAGEPLRNVVDKNLGY